jgi:DNA-directed RNA polymerase specialized sigma24 family protein
MPAPSPPPPSPRHALADFLSRQEARALYFAETCAPGQPALDWVQGAMNRFVQRARRRHQVQWPALFWAALLDRLPAVYWVDPPRPGPPAVLDEATLHAALHTVAPEQRCAFLLRAWIGLDLDGCAGALGCSRADASEHVYFAVQRLRPQLQAMDGDDGWIGASRRLLEHAARRRRAAERQALARAREIALRRRGRQLALGAIAAAASLALLLVLSEGWLPAPPRPTPSMPPAASTPVVDVAIERLLSLPAEDFALLEAPAEFGLLTELELQLWLLQHAPEDDPDDAD